MQPGIYNYAQLKGKIEVGRDVSAVPGKYNPCTELNKDGSNTQKITKVTENFFYINGCFYGYRADFYLEVLPKESEEPFTRGQQVRLKNTKGRWYSENVGKIGTYYGVHPDYEGDVIVHFPNGKSNLTRRIDLTDGKPYDIGKITSLEAVEDKYTYGAWEDEEIDPMLRRQFTETISTGLIGTLLTSTSQSQSLKEKAEKAMNKLSQLAYSVRKGMSAEQKALFQDGWKDENGKWTEKALQYAQEQLQKEWLDAQEKEIAEMAKENLAEEKEESK